MQQSGMYTNESSQLNHASSAATIDRPLPVPMSVVEQGQYIAFAAYNEFLNQILMETCIIPVGCEMRDIAARVIATVKPTLLLISTKICSNAGLLEVLSTPPFTPTDGDATEANVPPSKRPPTQGSIPYRLLKTAVFDVRSCKANILKLQVASLKKSSEIVVVGRGGAINQPIRRFPVHDSNQLRI